VAMQIAQRMRLPWEAPAQCLHQKAAPMDLNAAAASAIPASSRVATLLGLPMAAGPGEDLTLMPA